MSSGVRQKFGVAVASLVWITGASAQTSATTDLRDRFRAAYFAAAIGADLTEERDDAALRDYPIYAYLEAARIAKALSLVDATNAAPRDAQARAFLERHDGEPVTDAVALAWLESLARRDNDALLLENFRADIATAELQCHWFNARIAVGQSDGLAEAILQRWLTPGRLPADCEPAFQWLRDAGTLDADWTERRLRLLLESGNSAFAAVIARQLPAERAGPWRAWADLIASPAAAIDAAIADPSIVVEFEALLDGFTRLATADPDAGIARLQPLIEARRLDGPQASRLRRALAYGLAWDRDRRALDYFAQIDAADVDDYTLQWQARTALWSGDWNLVASSIGALSAAARDDSTWVYWAARAAHELGDRTHARELYESIRDSDNFYAMLASARLGREHTPHIDRFAVDESLVAAIAERAPIVRARELRAVDLPGEAMTEWRRAMAALDADARRQSIHLAADWGWYDVAIATATSEEIFFDYDLLYPRPFDRDVAQAARLTRLDRPLIYGVIRQESLYRPDASSGAGALGLMQLVPETARLTAASWNLPRPNRDTLIAPQTNIELGAAHLRDLVERFDGQLAVALAAYNAGPAAVAGWLPPSAIATDIWIENIPYNETRAYVRRVLWHSLVFKWLDERRAQDASAWLGDVRPVKAAD